MSCYSGKADCYDYLIAINRYTDEELKNNVDIYIGDIKTPLKIQSRKDLIPCYPHLVTASFHDNESRKATIYISSESWVDREERDNLRFILKDILRIYNRCKRNKIEFDVEEAVKQVTWNGWNEDAYRELANRVAKSGKKATIDGIHLKMHEYYRQELVNCMIENGLNPCRYGDYERFVKKEM